ncbi:MAG: GGDEF domain-containing protein [Actinomycetota bacterium]
MTVLIVAVVAFAAGVAVGFVVARQPRRTEPSPEPAAASEPFTAALDDVDLLVDDLEVEPVAAAPAPEGDDALTDPETGLLNERFFAVTLEARISAARRHLRPVAVVVLEVVEGIHDTAPRSADAPTIAAAIEKTLREADTACRLAGGRFGLVLEDTPETGAVWTVERLRRNLAPTNPGYTMWAGVACYPAHAFNAEEILARADQALVAAKEWRQDRIEVATASE